MLIDNCDLTKINMDSTYKNINGVREYLNIRLKLYEELDREDKVYQCLDKIIEYIEDLKDEFHFFMEIIIFIYKDLKNKLEYIDYLISSTNQFIGSLISVRYNILKNDIGYRITEKMKNQFHNHYLIYDQEPLKSQENFLYSYLDYLTIYGEDIELTRTILEEVGKFE